MLDEPGRRMEADNGGAPPDLATPGQIWNKGGPRRRGPAPRRTDLEGQKNGEGGDRPVGDRERRAGDRVAEDGGQLGLAELRWGWRLGIGGYDDWWWLVGAVDGSGGWWSR